MRTSRTSAENLLMSAGACVAAIAIATGCAANHTRARGSAPAVERAPCPIAGEQAEDCPYAGIARDLEGAASPADGARDRILSRLARESPALDAAIASVSTIGGDDLKYVDLWGRSGNYDASQLDLPSPRPTVDEAVLDAINARAGMPGARHGNFGPIHDAVTFAGVEHTYGYVFSLLPTPFGFKRARWVRDDLEAGFGLSRGTLGPLPKDGSLFANVTYFAGKIAFRTPDDARELAAVGAGARGVSTELRAFDFARLAPVRVEETLHIPLANGASRTVVLRTDFVPFVARTAAPDGNTNLLVYSARDSADQRARLVTVFPVGTAMRTKALDPARTGSGQPIATQYNAFIEGITGAAAPLTGERRILER
ncbi:hypothetical protein AKJ09_06906 [Labilithrix luteola]|uniref:Lipoprotein n=2 Tax=Labilithrix luteola TaxID=1391654 RepID=A0A0K1Q3E0_9BACT|nr:hypothetical protein AKJ09_06906 [Labilithrix luteola]